MSWKDLNEQQKLDVKHDFIAVCTMIAVATLCVWIMRYVLPSRPTWQSILEWFR